MESSARISAYSWQMRKEKIGASTVLFLLNKDESAVCHLALPNYKGSIYRIDMGSRGKENRLVNKQKSLLEKGLTSFIICLNYPWSSLSQILE